MFFKILFFSLFFFWTVALVTRHNIISVLFFFFLVFNLDAWVRATANWIVIYLSEFIIHTKHAITSNHITFVCLQFYNVFVWFLVERANKCTFMSKQSPSYAAWHRYNLRTHRTPKTKPQSYQKCNLIFIFAYISHYVTLFLLLVGNNNRNHNNKIEQNNNKFIQRSKCGVHHNVL